MAENILGLLFVTSSSRGRHVFRYPPDPASPNVRLAQPVYSAATYTATEPDTDFRGDVAAFRRKLFGPGPSVPLEGSGFTYASGLGTVKSDDRRSGGAGGTSASSHRRSGKKRDDLQARYMNYHPTSDYDDDSEAGASSSEYDSDYDLEWNTASGAVAGAAGTHSNGGPAAGTAITGGIGSRHTSGHHPNPTSHSRRNDSDATNGGLRSLESSTVIDASRRGSASTTIDLAHSQLHPDAANGDSSKNAAPAPAAEEKFMEGQYNYALGYPLSFLSDMLTPPRAACNRKFELNVESLVFIGHPVCCGADGKWEVPADDDELEERGPSRGRRMRDGPTQINASSLSSLGTLHEYREAGSSQSPELPSLSGDNGKLGAPPGPNVANANANGTAVNGKDDNTPSLNMFHLVLIIDKPDPQPGQGQEINDDHHSQTLGMYDEVYREIAFKWTAAAYKLQCESNFVAKQAWEMARFKERCLADGVPIIDFCRETSRLSALSRSLELLYIDLYNMRRRPANPLYSYLPTTITTTLLDMKINMVLSPRLVKNDEEWAHWGEMGDVSDTDSDLSDRDRDRSEWDDPTCPVKRPELRVEPWQTLLLIDDDAMANSDEISMAVLGLGLGMDDAAGGDEGRDRPQGERRGSRGTVTTMATAEEDETALMKALIEACDVTKPLVEIAHNLRFDLEGIVIPLARELVQSKKAIIIDIVNSRLRTIVMPTTVEEHASSIDQYTLRFAREFPSLPAFPQFIASISASPAAFRDLLPADANQSVRQTYMHALLWLLKQDLVVQVHTRIRIFARKEVKVEAWKRLWKRKREAWLTKLQAKEDAEAAEEAAARAGAGAGAATGVISPSISISGEDMITPRAVDNVVTNPLESATATVPPPYPSRSSSQTVPNHADQSMHFDPDQLDSDDEQPEGPDGADGEAGSSGFIWNFNREVEEPTRFDIPKFNSSFIFRPSRAQKDEARWIKVIREAADEVWASKFDLCVQYLDGVATFEEISYRTGLPRRELDKILQLYKDDIVTFLHP